MAKIIKAVSSRNSSEAPAREPTKGKWPTNPRLSFAAFLQLLLLCHRFLLQSTGLTGLAVSTNPHHTLSALYGKILRAVSKMPQDASYRKYTEQLVKQRADSVAQVRLFGNFANLGLPSGWYLHQSICSTYIDRATKIQILTLVICIKDCYFLDHPPISFFLIQSLTFSPAAQGHHCPGKGRRLRSSGGANCPGRERADPCAQNARLEALGEVGPSRACQAVGLATSPDHGAQGLDSHLVLINLQQIEMRREQ